jgi:hypothetical protein
MPRCLSSQFTLWLLPSSFSPLHYPQIFLPFVFIRVIWAPKTRLNKPGQNEASRPSLTSKQWCFNFIILLIFHCFTVPFNSLYIMVQLMHLFVIKH